MLHMFIHVWFGLLWFALVLWHINHCICDTMWVVRQADDPFVCFGAKPNKGLSSRSLTRPEVGEKRQLPKEPRECLLAKEPWEGQLAKRDAEKQSRTNSIRDQSRWVSSPEWTTVSRRRQWGRRSKMSWHSLWLLWEFREKYTPSDSLLDAQKAVQKSVTKLPFLHFELT